MGTPRKGRGEVWLGPEGRGGGQEGLGPADGGEMEKEGRGEAFRQVGVCWRQVRRRRVGLGQGSWGEGTRLSRAASLARSSPAAGDNPGRW